MKREGPGLCSGPVAPLNDSGWFVDFAFGQPAFFPLVEPQQQWPHGASYPLAGRAELFLNIATKFVHFLADTGVRMLQPVLHSPKRRAIGSLQIAGLPFKSLADSRIRMMLVALPTTQGGFTDAIQTRAVTLEIAQECPIQEL